MFGNPICSPNCLGGIKVQDLFLGSVNNKERFDTALIRLIYTGRSIFSNISMQGGHTAVRISGSIGNSFYDLKSASNRVRSFPLAECNVEEVEGASYKCWTKQWVHLETLGDVSSNANLFFNSVFEGGVDGIRVTEFGAQGGVKFYGGVISVFGVHGFKQVHEHNDEHRPGNAVHITGSQHPIKLSGLHIEGGNVTIEGAHQVSIDNSLVIGDCKDCIGGGTVEIMPLNEGTSRDTSVTNSKVEKLIIREGSIRTRLENLSLGVYKYTDKDSLIDESGDTFYLNVSPNVVGDSRKTTLGFGAKNPVYDPSNQLHDRVNIKGDISSSR